MSKHHPVRSDATRNKWIDWLAKKLPPILRDVDPRMSCMRIGPVQQRGVIAVMLRGYGLGPSKREEVVTEEMCFDCAELEAASEAHLSDLIRCRATQVAIMIEEKMGESRCCWRRWFLFGQEYGTYRVVPLIEHGAC